MTAIGLQEIYQKLKQTGRYWIVFTGDSITSCEWVHPNWRDILIYVLQEEMTKQLAGNWKLSEWGIKGFNFAYDGATTRDIREKLEDILLVKPDLVVGLMGGNDPVFRISVEESVKNIEQITNRAVETGAKVVWCTSTPAAEGSKKNDEYQPYAEAALKIPEKDNFYLIDMFTHYRQFPLDKFFTFLSEENPVEGVKKGDPDLQHPNQLGNAYISKIVLEEVLGISFDPEKYIRETLGGKKFPGYSD